MLFAPLSRYLLAHFSSVELRSGLLLRAFHLLRGGAGGGAAPDLDFNLPRLGFGLLREAEGQHTVDGGGVHLLGVDRVRQCEGAGEVAVAALDAVEVVLFGVRRKAPLAGKR